MKTQSDTTIIAPSILNADYGALTAETQKVEAAGCDWIHLDVMDGSFVPMITFGSGVTKAIRQAVKIPLDVHLMIVEPEKHIDAFVEAGADLITVHVETCPHLHRTLQQIHSRGVKAGVALNPGTPVEALSSVINDLDLILIMTVNPGWGGQKFIPTSVGKIRQAAALLGQRKSSVRIEVDGGINPETAKACREAGADTFVVGTYIFRSNDYKTAISALR